MNKARLFLLSTAILALLPVSGNSVAEEPGHWFNASDNAWKSGFDECWDSAFPGRQGAECGGEAPPPAEPEMTGHFWADDQDGDGVLDKDDACPFTPEGVSVDNNGCALDNDGDGVPDYRDDCPETPFGSVVDTSGCPLAVISLKDIHFAFDSSRLTSEARTLLNRALPGIKASSGNLIIEGHTDSTGSDSYNIGLSKRRAQSVRDYLVSQGVSSSRLTVVGKGENFPIASNDTREGRAQNRRVEAYFR